MPCQVCCGLKNPGPGEPLAHRTGAMHLLSELCEAAAASIFCISSRLTPMQPPGSDVTLLKKSCVTWAMMSITAVNDCDCCLDEQKHKCFGSQTPYLDHPAPQWLDWLSSPKDWASHWLKVTMARFSCRRRVNSVLVASDTESE
jgi:hypothetical protein